ncbi:hypothetical protein LINGRAHAP2_LOCUS23966, partial [Linum grandiflorum]
MKPAGTEVHESSVVNEMEYGWARSFHSSMLLTGDPGPEHQG